MKLRVLFLLLIASLIILAAFFIPNLFYGIREETGTPPMSQTRLKPTSTPQLKAVEPLIVQLAEIISKENAIFGLEVYELRTGRRYGINQENIFHAASVGKLVVATYVLLQVDQVKVGLDRIVDGASLKERLRLMINQSDNGSWEALLTFFGYAKIHQFEKEIGLSSSNVYKNEITVRDVNNLLVKIYQGNLLSESSRELLLGWMQNTEREERIPQAVPKSTTVYHKAGTFEGETHDAAIILHPESPFVLTILSQAKYDTSPALREITRAVYDFFQ